MQAKLFEIRDEGTTIPTMAVRMKSDEEVEQWIIHRAGYVVLNNKDMFRQIILTNLNTSASSHDPHNHGRSRTMREAHLYIEKNWDTLESGDLIDVQFLRGETDKPKVSEGPLGRLQATE